MKITLKQFIENWDNGVYSNNIQSMISAGWFDWFCEDKSLYNRLKKIIGMIKAVNNSPAINSDEVQIFFKNNCPITGSLYDSFWITDIETGNVKYWVTGRIGYDNSNNEARIFKSPDFENSLISNTATEEDVKNYFKNLKY